MFYIWGGLNEVYTKIYDYKKKCKELLKQNHELEVAVLRDMLKKRIHSSIDYRTPQEFYDLKNNVFKNKLVVKL